MSSSHTTGRLSASLYTGRMIERSGFMTCRSPLPEEDESMSGHAPLGHRLYRLCGQLLRHQPLRHHEILSLALPRERVVVGGRYHGLSEMKLEDDLGSVLGVQGTTGVGHRGGHGPEVGLSGLPGGDERVADGQPGGHHDPGHREDGLAPTPAQAVSPGRNQHGYWHAQRKIVAPSLALRDGHEDEDHHRPHEHETRSAFVLGPPTTDRPPQYQWQQQRPR